MKKVLNKANQIGIIGKDVAGEYIDYLETKDFPYIRVRMSDYNDKLEFMYDEDHHELDIMEIIE